MSGDAEIRFTGTVVADPELSLTSAGVSWVRFRVAVTPRIRRGEEWVDGDTTFFGVSAWRRLAENVAASLQRGDRVTVAGTIASREFEHNGEKRLSWDVTAAEVAPSLSFATAKPAKVRREQLQAVPASA